MHMSSTKSYALAPVLSALVVCACSDIGNEPLKQTDDSPMISANAGPATQALPNVVLIVADDLGWSDLPAYGNSRHVTPNIDRLAGAGIRLTNYYAYPVCTPSRVALMTGQNPARLRKTAVIPDSVFPYTELTLQPLAKRLPDTVPTLGRLMQNAGYATAYYGKWHLGGPGASGAVEYGYHESLLTFGMSHLAGDFRTGPDTELPEGALLGDVITDRAIDFIKRHERQRFHVEIHHFSPHVPLQPKAETLERVRQRFEREGHDGNMLYAAMIEDLDANIGHLLDTLHGLGLEGRTLVMFMSDNGGILQSRMNIKWMEKLFKLDTGPITTNTPLRSGKGAVYEGGIRVPFIARWPGVIPAGARSHTVASMMDIRPTLSELVSGVTREQLLQDGSSFLGSLSDPSTAQPRPPLFIHYPHYRSTHPATVVRIDEWKLIYFYEQDAHELYNLATDPGETTNLVKQEPAIAGELNRLMTTWLQQTGAALPLPNPAHDPDRADKMSMVKMFMTLLEQYREFTRHPD